MEPASDDRRVEIVPEPDPAERDAIVRAATSAKASSEPRTAWWREGVRENLRERPER